MQGKHLYEYAVIRVLPKVEREEFINVGLILFSKKRNYIKAKCVVDEKKFRAFAPQLDLAMICENLSVYEKICTGNIPDHKIAQMDVPERFRWLTAVRSTIIQTSRPHPGFTADLDATFDKLFEELVL